MGLVINMDEDAEDTAFTVNMLEDGTGGVVSIGEGSQASLKNANMRIGGSFINHGSTRIDVSSTLDIAGDVVNNGEFDIRNYVAEARYSVIEDAITSLNGEPKAILQGSYGALRTGEVAKANNLFKSFFAYIKKHPELAVGSVGILIDLLDSAG